MPSLLVWRRSSTLRTMPVGVSTVARPNDSCRLVARLGEQDVDRDFAAGIEIDGGDMAFLIGDLHDPASDDSDVAARHIGLDIRRNVTTIGEDSRRRAPKLSPSPVRTEKSSMAP